MSAEALARNALALREAVFAARTILVASEPLPDGDAFGAQLAIRGFVEAAFGLADTREAARAGQGPKHVALLNEKGIPARYAFLDGSSSARPPAAEDQAGFDLGIVVDGGVERCGGEVRALFERCAKKAYVDHHRHGSRETYDVVLLDPERAATTELLATLLETPAWSDVPLTRPLAEALYVGLVTDTGSFVYSLTTPRTHRIAARLLEAGARSSMIGEKVMLDIDEADLRLLGRVVSGLEIEHEGRLAVAVMTLDMQGGRAPHDVGYDKVVTPIAFLATTRVTVLFREVEPEVWKLSFRSRGEVDVAALARELDPEGGGHARAAGCLLLGPIAAVRARTVAAVGRRLG